MPPGPLHSPCGGPGRLSGSSPPYDRGHRAFTFVIDTAPVSLPPDDLPRSPSGRTPQWVIDGVVGGTTATPGWLPSAPTIPPPAPPQPERRRNGKARLVVVLVLVLGGWWLASGAPGLPVTGGGPLAAQPSQVPPASVPVPSAEVVGLADAAYLSAEGRELFYATRPELLDAASFAGRCDDAQAARPVPAGSTVGCYRSATDSILVYVPADARLHGFVVETAAHELLHAAWERLTSAEQAAITPILEAEVAALAGDDPIHEQIAGSVGDHAENRPTELFAYVGTQVWREGGLDPSLEQVYGRLVDDRAALVAVHTGWVAMLDEMAAALTASFQALADQEAVNALARAQYEADVASAAGAREKYESWVADARTMSVEERERTQMSWTWWDGTPFPAAPIDEALAEAAVMVQRDEAALPDRALALQAAEDAAAAERARLEGLVADLEVLQAQMDPATAA